MKLFRKLKESGIYTTVVFYSIYLLVMLMFLIGGWLVRSHFEAKTYNRLTESSVTMFDAMWVQFRVVEPLK
jgi:hypothetical protein